MDQARVIISFERVDPANVAHGRVISLHVELVLETDWKAMERAHWAAMCGEVFVQLFGSLQGLVEKDFVQTVVLRDGEAAELGLHCNIELATQESKATHNLVSDCCHLAKGAGDLHRAVLAFVDARHY